MIYDYIIAGSGIAGSICAYELSRHNKSCVILEKEPGRFEKICGGGVSYKVIRILKEIGINIEEILGAETSIVNGHTFFHNNKVEKYNYKTGVFALGTPRYIFDEFLLKQSVKQGAIVKYNEKVNNIIKEDNLYIVNNYKAYNFVCAVGARGINNHIPKGQSVGISAQIVGQSILESDKFYFWYYSDSEDKYFWLFPIGRNLWNVGVWFKKPDSSMKRDFINGMEKIIKPYFKLGYSYKILPKGEFLGNIDQRSIAGNYCDGIGDFAGKNNIKNGGGIIYAIESALEYATREIATIS